MDIETIDIQSNDIYVDGPPFETFAWLRNNAPALRHPGMNDLDVEWFWALTRHADVVEVSRQFQTYSSERNGVLLMERDNMEETRLLTDIDPPEHTRMRGLVNRGFTPRAIKLMSDNYIAVTEQLVGEAVEQGDVEFVTKVAAELPLIAIAQMMGIPVEDRSRVFDWSNRMIGQNDADYSGGFDDAAAAAIELYGYAQALADDRRAAPRDDIISILVAAEGNDALTEHEFNMFVLLLAVAGNETTRNAISHGVHALIENPDQWELLRDNPSLVDSAVEEILRWSSPVNVFRRTATCDVELHGETIREGDSVAMFYASANRDETVFANPDRFDITRDPNPHVTFGGGGPHFCLGANLARLEMRTLFGELARRCERIEPAGEVKRLRSYFINGIKTLPVTLIPR
jgi:cholest-4-en-3-one 26-monooxygenase